MKPSYLKIFSTNKTGTTAFLKTTLNTAEFRFLSFISCTKHFPISLDFWLLQLQSINHKIKVLNHYKYISKYHFFKWIFKIKNFLIYLYNFIKYFRRFLQICLKTYFYQILNLFKYYIFTYIYLLI